ncbi:ABC-three component system middle component 7 [uncultured Fibrobacter sp.]|uniref:ABC-three component system middle component 7 n=1 Tax=uncultured Fibrobacter sp. TaxID=261512 RepID=UPI002593543A|nr:ABC-three component system middle component 7 [uncultured Fibrobacter sp.]
MNLPDKFTTFNDSSLSKIPVVLNGIKNGLCNPVMLWEKKKEDFDNICEFMEVLDILYSLGKVKMGEKRGVLEYVD